MFVREVRIFVCVCTSVCLGGSRVFCQVQPRAGELKCADGEDDVWIIYVIDAFFFCPVTCLKQA